MNTIEFDIKLAIHEAEALLQGLMKLPKEIADPIFNKLQGQAIQAVQAAQQVEQPVTPAGQVDSAPVGQQ